MVLGALGAGDSGAVHEILLRRYRCLGCGAVLTVGPRDLLPGMLYSLVTVVVALAQWGQGATTSSVRAQLGAFSVIGNATLHDWCSLRRWARRAAGVKLLGEVCVQISGTLRERATRWVCILTGAGPPGDLLPLRALAGARHYR